MVGLADGELSERDLDDLSFALATREELTGLGWDDAMARAARLRDEAPLFPEARARMVRRVGRRDERKLLLSLVARLLRAPLPEAEAAFLDRIAEDLEIPESERAPLFEPWTALDPLSTGWVRCRFNDPASSFEGSLFDAMADAADDVELGLLTFKLAATRVLIDSQEGASLAAVGERVVVGGGQRLRVDALIATRDRRWITRVLARGEALHARELSLWPSLVERLDPSAGLWFAYAESMSPRDVAALETLPAERVSLSRLPVW